MIQPPLLVEAQMARQTDWHHYQTVTLDHLTDFRPESIALGKFGGRMDRREEATGFCHSKQLDDRWIIVDPEGYHFFGVGVNSVSPVIDFPPRDDDDF